MVQTLLGAWMEGQKEYFRALWLGGAASAQGRLPVFSRTKGLARPWYFSEKGRAVGAAKTGTHVEKFQADSV